MGNIYFDVWGWKKANNWILIDTFVDEQLARDFVKKVQANNYLQVTKIEIRKSIHIESFGV